MRMFGKKYKAHNQIVKLVAAVGYGTFEDRCE